MLLHHYLNMVGTTLNTWKWCQIIGNNIEQQKITLSYFVLSFITIKKVVLVVHLLFLLLCLLYSPKLHIYAKDDVG